MMTVDGRLSALTATLLDAYRRAHYVVPTEPPCVMQIDRYCEALDTLQRRYSVNGSVFITAYNPASQLLSTIENERRQCALTEEIRHLGLAFFEGVGESPDGSWDAEPSLLVLGLDRRDALLLARRYGQNAVLVSGQDAIPRLLCLV